MDMLTQFGFAHTAGRTSVTLSIRVIRLSLVGGKDTVIIRFLTPFPFFHLDHASACPGLTVSNFSKQPMNKSPCNLKHRNTTNNYFSTQAKHRHDTERRHCRGKNEKSLDGVFVDVETASTTFILGIRIVQNNRTTEEATVRFFSLIFNNQRYREYFE